MSWGQFVRFAARKRDLTIPIQPSGVSQGCQPYHARRSFFGAELDWLSSAHSTCSVLRPSSFLLLSYAPPASDRPYPDQMSILSLIAEKESAA